MENDDIRVDELVQEDVNEAPTEETAVEEEPSTDWEAEALKYKAEAAKLNAILARKNKRDAKEPLQEQPQVEDDVKSTVAQLKQAEDKRQFGYEHNLSPEEVNAIFKINPNPTKETLDDPFVKGGLERIRSQKRVDANTPRTSSRSGSLSSLKNASKKPASKADLQTAFEKKRDTFLKGR